MVFQAMIHQKQQKRDHYELCFVRLYKSFIKLVLACQDEGKAVTLNSDFGAILASNFYGQCSLPLVG